MGLYEDILAAAQFYLPMQDTAASTSVAGGGTIVGGETAATLTVSDGPRSWLRRGFALDGASDYITIPSGTISRNVGSMSVWGWGRTTSTSSTQAHIIGVRGSSSLRLGLRCLPSLSQMSCLSRAGDGESLQGSPQSVASVNGGAWHLYGATVDYANDSIRLYYDGALVATLAASFAATATADTQAQNIHVGATNGVEKWLGDLAGAGLTHRLLSDADHAALYAGPTGPVAYVTSRQLTADLSAYSFSGVPIDSPSADRGLALAVHSRGGSGEVLNSLTVDGVSATKITGIENSTTGAGNSTNWYAIDKPTGDTADIVATFASTQARCQIDVYRLLGVDIDTIVGTATSGTRPANLSLPARPGGVVLAAGNVAQTGRTPTWAGVTEDATASLEGFVTTSSASHVASDYEPSRTVTLDWDTTGVDFAAAAISLGGSLVRHFTRSPFTRSPLVGGGFI